MSTNLNLEERDSIVEHLDPDGEQLAALARGAGRGAAAGPRGAQVPLGAPHHAPRVAGGPGQAPVPRHGARYGGGGARYYYCRDMAAILRSSLLTKCHVVVVVWRGLFNPSLRSILTLSQVHIIHT